LFEFCTKSCFPRAPGLCNKIAAKKKAANEKSDNGTQENLRAAIFFNGKIRYCGGRQSLSASFFGECNFVSFLLEYFQVIYFSFLPERAGRSACKRVCRRTCLQQADKKMADIPSAMLVAIRLCDLQRSFRSIVSVSPRTCGCFPESFSSPASR
jgi:hypothetical protein